MIKYNAQLNNGNEYFGIEGKTITANEVVETVEIKDLAIEINHENTLIPTQVAESVLQNFAKAAAHLMSMGFAIQFKNGEDVVMRIYPDIHIKGGNINLERAKQLDPTVNELTLENAGDLVDKAGVTVRTKAECEQKFTDLLLAQGATIQRTGVIEKAKITRAEENNTEEPANGDNNGGGDNGGGFDTGS